MWRLVVVGCAVTGYAAAVTRSGGDLRDATLPLSQLASLVTGVGYTALVAAGLVAGTRRPEPPSAWLRGLLTLTLALVAVVWFTVMGGDVTATWSLFEHLLTPLAVLVDWLVCGRGQADAPWWYPLTWGGALLVYLGVLLGSDEVVYPFLDPRGDRFTVTLVGLCVGVLLGGYAVLGLGRLRGRHGRGGRR